MRVAIAALACLLVVSACGTDDEAEQGDAAGDGVDVLVIADGSAGDLRALDHLTVQPEVDVAAVIVTGADVVCETVASSIGAALGDRAPRVPIACGDGDSADTPTSDIRVVPLGSLDEDILRSADAVLVLAPMTDLADLVDRVAGLPVIAAPGTVVEGVHTHLRADPGAAQRVVAALAVTFVVPGAMPPSAGTDLSAADLAELVAAQLIVDESDGSYRVERSIITDTGAISSAPTGRSVRFLDAADGAAVVASEPASGPEAQTDETDEPVLLWRIDVEGGDPGHHRRAAVAGEVVIVGGGNGIIYAVSPATGTVEWTIDTGFDGEFATNVAHADGVAVLSNGSTEGAAFPRVLTGVDVAEESVMWTFDPASAAPEMTVVSNAALADGVVYAGASTGLGADATGIVFALDLRSGELLWMSPGLGGASEPLVDGDDLIVGGGDGTVRVYDRRSGELQWADSVVVAENGIASRPLAIEGVIYVTGDDGSVHAFNQRTGEQVWRRQLSTQPIPASPVVANGRLIVAELFAGTTWALDPASGDTLWSANAGPVLGDPLVVGDSIIVTTFGPPSVAALDVETGTEMWRFDNPEIIGGTPILVDNVVIYQGVDVYGLQLP